PAAPRAVPANSSTCAPPTVKDRWTRRPRGGWYGRGRSHETADHYSGMAAVTDRGREADAGARRDAAPSFRWAQLRGPAAVRGRRSRARRTPHPTQHGAAAPL